MKKFLSTLLVLCLMSMVFLAGCSENSGSPTDGSENSSSPTDSSENSSSPTDSSEKLTEYLDASQDELAEVVEMFKDTMDISITAEGTTLVYTYKFIIDVELDETKLALEEQESTLKLTAESAVLPEMEAFGISNPKVKYVYLSNDGTEIYSVLFE